MPDAPTAPAKASPLVHLKRAFTWNLGRTFPSAAESAALDRAGLVDPVVQRYAAWRRSLLFVAAVPTLLALVLALLDTFDAGFDEFTALGVAIECTWLLAAAALPFACFLGIRSWHRPGSGARLLRASWLVAFVVPFVYALLPYEAVFHVHGEPEATGEAAEKALALARMALDFVLSGSAYLLLLPAVLSIIPGAVNGCLRIKALFPAAQLPGWLLVCAAPAFLLFWLVILVVVNHAAQSPLLVLGIVLWAGSPIWYAVRGKIFVQSQITDADAAKIGRVKRVVGILGLAGVAFMLTFVATKKVAGLHVLGTDPEKAFSTRLEELADADDETGIEDVSEAFQESDSFLYALDLSSWRLIVDFLAKMLLVTAVFADLILRATLSAWRNDRDFRSKPASSAFDASAAAAVAALSPAPAAP